jgi:hypothetical protein
MSLEKESSMKGLAIDVLLAEHKRDKTFLRRMFLTSILASCVVGTAILYRTNHDLDLLGKWKNVQDRINLISNIPEQEQTFQNLERTRDSLVTQMYNPQGYFSDEYLNKIN